MTTSEWLDFFQSLLKIAAVQVMIGGAVWCGFCLYRYGMRQAAIRESNKQLREYLQKCDK